MVEEALHVRALAGRAQDNMIATFALACERMDGGLVARLDGAVVVAAGLPLLLFNQLLIEDRPVPQERVAAAIAAGVAVFRERGTRFAVTLRDGTDDAFRPLVAELGLALLPDSPRMPGMALHPLPASGGTPAPPGHEIRRVTDARGLADHADVLADGFGMPRAWAAAFATDRMAAAPGIAFYVGYQDGAPVTSGVGVQTGRTIGVYNIATVEAARRRGLGAAMTMRVVDEGAAAGCDTAILQASEMGLSVYERLGFRTVVEYAGYIDGGADADEDADEAR